MEKVKKMTNAQLKKRLENAVLHIDRTTGTRSVAFRDKGLIITLCDDYALIATNYHTHVFYKMAATGYSRPYLYTETFMNIFDENRNALSAKDYSYSYGEFFSVLKEKEDKRDFNIATFYDWWLYNIFQPLYSIGESVAETFLVYETYVHNIARNSVILSEKTDDMTNRQFARKVSESYLKMIDGTEEQTVFVKKTDDDIVDESIAPAMDLFGGDDGGDGE